MRRRALFMGGKKQLPLIIRVDTTKSGATPSDTFRIPTTTSETYKYRVDWGDGVVTSNHTGNAEHTYAVGGIYDIKIYGKFPRFYFNNGGDRLKLLEVRHWGDIKYSANQTGAFWGCNNLTFIATDENAWYNYITIGNDMFRNATLLAIPDNMLLTNLTNGIRMFATSVHQGLQLLPDGMTLSSLTDGTQMFYGNSLTSLPDGMTLDNLMNGFWMFRDNALTSLPDAMTLNSLTNGSQMFRDNSLTSLPDNMTLNSLTDGGQMFYGNSLTSLPDGMELPLLTNGVRMFYNNSLTSLPNGMTLSNLTDGTQMFQNNPITSAIGLKLHKINLGLSFMNLANLPVSQYSSILVDIEANNPNDDVIIDFGSSKYNATAVTARANLIARGWNITDGGLE